MKPLFIPLKAEHYDDFAAGTKDTEYRMHGARWNSDTCYPGRAVVLSRGYGKAHRLHGHIESFSVDYDPAKLKGWTECYGDRGGWAACIKIRLARTSSCGAPAQDSQTGSTGEAADTGVFATSTAVRP